MSEDLLASKGDNASAHLLSFIDRFSSGESSNYLEIVPKLVLGLIYRSSNKNKLDLGFSAYS